jgi:uncharacterized protein YqjF (DUF2071 family)
MAGTFLKAEWRKLLMVNYGVADSVLEPYLPDKTELDHWNGRSYISLVGFMFLDTRLKGLPIPFHRNFQEVNLRFYVRRKEKEEWKRGVVFMKEIVPKRAMTFIARSIYRENYETMPMKHEWRSAGDQVVVQYSWKKNGWNSIRATARSLLHPISAGSEEEFITEHYWGYARVGSTKTTEYKVEHPVWEIYKVEDYTISVDFENIYGREFRFLKDLTPLSVFLAEGSHISVSGKKYL